MKSTSSDSEIQAVIFDSDGTLVDSEPLSLEVLCESLSKYGALIPVGQALQQWSGADLFEVLENVQREFSITLPDSFLDEFREAQLERLAIDVQPIEGTHELLQSLAKPKCVASNAPVVKVELCLNTTGLLRYFDQANIFSAYQVQKWKPDPAVFLYAAKQMGFDPKYCAVVEDSVFGVQAGLTAGMQVFAYDPNGRIPESPGVTKIKRLTELIEVFG